MRIPKLAIENHQFTIMVVILLVLSGLASLFTMPRSEDPQVSPSGSSVIVIFPGANPADMEELIANPIEEVINELEDIKRLTSVSEDGLVIVAVEFESGSNSDDKYSDVVQKVNSIRSKLPEEIASLEIQKWTISDVCILQTAIISDSASYRELEYEAERLEKTLEKVPGIKYIKTWAFPQQEIRVSVDLEKLAQYRLSLEQVIGAIQSVNANIPGGSIDIGMRKFTVQTSGSYQSIADIRNTIVHSLNGKIVYLKDIADVESSYEDNNYFARVSGKRAVFVTASQKEGTNIFDVAGGLKEKLTKFENQLPQSMHIYNVFDQSQSVSHRVYGFFSNLLQGLLLVGLVVFLAVSVRATIIVILVIPLSILIGLGFVDISNYGLEQMSIAGLVIALGLLVDNAIVVTENISRFMKMGHSPKEAAIKGTKQIGWAVVSSTVTTILAFVPIIMMQNITGDFIRSMPVTVVYTLAASLLLSLTLTPYLSSKFIKVGDDFKESRIRQSLNSFIEKYYRKSLNRALSRPKMAVVAALLIFLCSLALFPVVGVSFFPKAEKPQFIINIETPKGTSIDKTDQVAQYVESALARRDEVKHYAVNIGHGNPRIYYNVMSKREQSNYSQVYVELKENDMQVLSDITAELRREFSDFPGAKIEVKEFEQGPPVEAPIAIKIIGKNLDILKNIARDVERMIADAPGTINIDNPMNTSKTDLHVNINRAKAAMLGIPLVNIDRTVRASIAGLSVSQYRDARGKEYDIVVRLPFSDKPTVSDFDKIYVSSQTGAQVPLKQIAAIEFKSTPLTINHFNLERNVALTADVMGNISVDKTTKQIIEKLKKYNLPLGYRYYIGGEIESREESFGGMAKAVIIALAAIFAVLVLQFRSFSQPLIVFSAIPLAIIGSVAALFITGNNFSFTAFVGITSLVGIVINNSIILVDYTNQLRKDGKPLITALKEAGEIRFIPIILTTATTVGGLLPLTLRGGTMWAPMGWTIIGGLIASTFLTLIFVPVLYKIFTPNAAANSK